MNPIWLIVLLPQYIVGGIWGAVQAYDWGKKYPEAPTVEVGFLLFLLSPIVVTGMGLYRFYRAVCFLVDRYYDWRYVQMHEAASRSTRSGVKTEEE